MTIQTIRVATPDLQTDDVIVGSLIDSNESVRITVRSIGSKQHHGGDTYYSIHTEALGTFQATALKEWQVERDVPAEPFKALTVVKDLEHPNNHFVRLPHGWLHQDGSQAGGITDEFLREDIEDGKSKIVFEPEA